MAMLPPYLGSGLQAGSRLELWAKILLPYIRAGRVTVLELDDFRFQFAGRIGTMLYSGSLDLAIRLVDQDREAPHGPAEVVVNDLPIAGASYRIDGGRLVLTGTAGEAQQEIVLQRSPNQRETWIDISGTYNHSVHLAPAR